MLNKHQNVNDDIIGISISLISNRCLAQATFDLLRLCLCFAAVVLFYCFSLDLERCNSLSNHCLCFFTCCFSLDPLGLGSSEQLLINTIHNGCSMATFHLAMDRRCYRNYVHVENEVLERHRENF